MKREVDQVRHLLRCNIFVHNILFHRNASGNVEIHSAEYWASKSAIYKDGNDFQMSPLGGYSDKDEELVEYFCSCSTTDMGDCQSDTTCFSGILTKYLYGFSIKWEYRPQYRPHSHESSSWQSWGGLKHHRRQHLCMCSWLQSKCLMMLWLRYGREDSPELPRKCIVCPGPRGMGDIQIFGSCAVGMSCLTSALLYLNLFGQKNSHFGQNTKTAGCHLLWKGCHD